MLFHNDASERSRHCMKHQSFRDYLSGLLAPQYVQQSQPCWASLSRMLLLLGVTSCSCS